MKMPKFVFDDKAMDGLKTDAQQPNDYIIHEGQPVAIIHRKFIAGQTEPCPFCGKSHNHSYLDGHRATTRCIQQWKKGNNGSLVQPKDCIIAADGTPLYRQDGYYLKTNPLLENSIFEPKNAEHGR